MSKILIKQISITDTGATAVVNAANNRLLAGAGVCGAIFKASGNPKALQAECNKYPGCKTGGAVITSGYSLAPYIIHAVGPIYIDGNHNEAKLLESAYKRALLVAKSYNIHDIAFPLISAGIYGYPIREAWQVALKSCDEFFKNYCKYELQITFAILDDKNIEIGLDVAEQLKI